MRFVIFGGGCYGTFYARQLLRAREAGALAVEEIVVVDHGPAPRARGELGEPPGLRFEQDDWETFLARYMERLAPAADDRLVTPPFTPHLALAWLLRVLRAEHPAWRWTLEPFRRLPGTPFERQAEGGPLVLSHADWVCPVHCIEPETCPATRGPRFWDLDRTVRDYVRVLEEAGQPIARLHLFHCHHLAFGVGAYPAAEVLRARADIARHLELHPGPAGFLVGTVSHCHGALHLLGAEPGMDREAASGNPPQLIQPPDDRPVVE